MAFNFSASAAQKLQQIMAGKGGALALHIVIRRSAGGEKWAMTLEPRSHKAVEVDGIPVVLDHATAAALEGIIIDWVQTPEGAGFGVYDRSLRQMSIK